MSRDQSPETPTVELERLLQVGPGTLSREDKLRLAQAIRARSRTAAQDLDAVLLGQIEKLHEGLEEALGQLQRMHGILKELTEPPWLAGTYLGAVELGGQHAVKVAYAGMPRVVRVPPDVDLSDVRVGDEVYLNRELNVVVGRSPSATVASGATAVVQRVLPDNRLVLRSRDEEIVVTAANALARGGVRAGDLVRWDRSLWLAFERIERDEGKQFFLEDTPRETFAGIGGLDRQIAELQRAVCPAREHRELARKYRLRPVGSVLLVGPPGTGKTMVARALANWMAEQSPSARSRFMSIKPGGLHSPWYAQSEANYREAFRAAREAGEADPDVPVVMFFDEVDSVGASRGQWGHRVDDRVLTAFMAELDGLEGRGNVVVVAATNRRDALDPALLRPGRLGDLVLQIPRPSRAAAREIFARHLGEDLPYASPPGKGPADVRQRVIDAALSRLYAPNGEGELAVLTLGDRQTRSVRATDLVSGALIASIARAAAQRALLREWETGDPGIRWTDLVEATEDALATAVEALSPANCHQLLDGLQPDQPVVRLERRKPLRVLRARVA